MRKIVFAFIVSCSSFFMESTPGMSGNPLDDQGMSSSVSSSKYRRLEGEYNDLMKYQEQSEMRYTQVKEELETAQKELKKLEKDKKKLEEDYKNLEEYHATMMEMHNGVSKRNEELEKENRELKATQKKLETEISTMRQKSAAINGNNNHMLRNLSLPLSEQVQPAERGEAEDSAIGRENNVRFWEEDSQIAEASLIGKNEKYSIIDSDLSYIYESELQAEGTNSGEVSEIFVGGNNLKIEIDEAGGNFSLSENGNSNFFQQNAEQIGKGAYRRDFGPKTENSPADSAQFLLGEKTMNLSVAEMSVNFEDIQNSPSDSGRSQLTNELSHSEDTRNLHTNFEPFLKMTKEFLDIRSKEEIFTTKSTFPAKEYFAENPSSSFVRSDFGLGDIKHSLNDSERKLEKALRKIQELKNALQKALDDKLEAENNNLRLKGVNDNLVRQLSEKNQEIKKFRNDFSEISRNVAEIFARMDSDAIYENNQRKNSTKLSLIKNKLSRINLIIRKSSPLPSKRGWNQNSCPTPYRQEIFPQTAKHRI